ncbi:S9 family peptidase [Plebeiibacterium sediminum]|uniref:S9 family peptidase n=1 Tax=Plebeiibacterium sediminum TaxID=2992112 RepID=A0AAE3M316_9BACT|nr:S9 family peptidase [Plebeiobacterium sediminum]MCW3786311.1 S9 family peptidase [Plebeiobacterium sediminum]
MKHFLLGFFIYLITCGVSTGQVTPADYERADTLYKFSGLVYGDVHRVQWIEQSHFFWYEVQTKRGTEYKIVDSEKQKVNPLFNQEKFVKSLGEVVGKQIEPYKYRLGNLSVNKQLNELNFEYNSKRLKCSLKKYSIIVLGDVETASERHWGWTDGIYDFDPFYSPDSAYVAYIKNYNVYVKELATNSEYQLSTDGSIGEFYSGEIHWSPDSKKIAALRIRDNEKHYIHLIESSPKDRLEPKLLKREYLKPGDALPIAKPCLFNVENKEQIPVDSKPFENQFSLEKLRWNKDSQLFTFEFNQRGHQVYQVVKVNASTGAYSVLIDEQSKTFIDYSGKYFRYDLKDKNQIIWASERDGWNHLYLIDGISGKVINQITKGQWVVRGVEFVDDKNQSLIFKGSGMNNDEDPYFIHYYKINLDGTNLVDLTPEKMNHQAVFSADYKWFVDTYSKVDEAPVTLVRNTADSGKKQILETANAEALLASDYRYPEVFVAKARDGKTDIWGNIYYPTNFDPNKKYPVIEYIYAGPQAAYTQKSFRAYNYAFSGLAELGFIIVQMDAMGTSYRSKAFHDVCFKNLKDAGFPDRIKWIKAAAKTHSFMDTTRVGIFGGSAGGQNSTAAVLFHPEFYKAAVSSCGCHDNRMDKMWWNEQWMGFPIGKHYEECSNIVNAYRLKGHLMLILGELDDNVDPSSTMQLADALIKANKDFELVVLPGLPHTLGGKFGEQKRRDFFVECFYKQFAPERNSK